MEGLNNGECHDLYFSSYIIRVTKSRRIRWARPVARMGKRTAAYGVLARMPE